MTATAHRTDPAPARASATAALALQTLALMAWLAAIGYDAGAPRTTIWSAPWIVVYTLGAAGALAAGRSAPGALRRWLGAGGAVLCALGAVLRSAAAPANAVAAGVLRPSDLPLLLALVVPTLVVTAGRRDRLAALGAGTFLVWWLTLLMEYVAHPNLWHGSEFYVVSGAAIPCALAFAAATGGNWGATWAAGWYMGILLTASGLFRALSGADGHLLPPPIPLVLVAPGIAIDLLARWIDASDRRWERALALGATGPLFVLIMLAAHWPLSEWLLRSSAALAATGMDRWPYHAAPGHWRYEFWTLDPGARALAGGLGLAVLVSAASAAAGWGLGRRTTGSSDRMPT